MGESRCQSASLAKEKNMSEKIGGVIAVMEQMVEIRYYIAEMGISVDSVACRICGQHAPRDSIALVSKLL